jgi:nucleoside-diphosphate-sugar epimerase
MTMKVLFIGGTGTISAAVSRLAIENKIDLYHFNRGNQPMVVPQGVTPIKGDIRDKDKAYELLKGYYFDTVVDWVAYTPEHVQTDIGLFKDRTAQYVFISSASACSFFTGYQVLN